MATEGEAAEEDEEEDDDDAPGSLLELIIVGPSWSRLGALWGPREPSRDPRS